MRERGGEKERERERKSEKGRKKERAREKETGFVDVNTFLRRLPCALVQSRCKYRERLPKSRI